MRVLKISLFVVALLMLPCVAALAQKPDYSGVGKVASPEEIKARDKTVSPDGKGLPEGSGTATQGLPIFQSKCSLCHGPTGNESKLMFARLYGGEGTLTTWWPDETPGSFWPYATSIFDIIRRAMPEIPLGPNSLPKDYIFTERPIPHQGGGETGVPAGALGMREGQLLTSEEVYALTAYILYKNGIIKEDEVMNRETLPKVVMPNRKGFMPPADVRWVWQSRDPDTRLEPHVSPNSKPLPTGSKPVNVTP